MTEGKGRYSWVDVDGTLRHGTHWDELPAEMDRLVAFVPDYPEPPHSAEDHAVIGGFRARLEEALSRCRR